MFVVIFRARVASLDDEYFRTAERLKELAFQEYGCQDFFSVTEGDQEVSISYWNTMQQIRDWKKCPEHVSAQKKGRQHWYRSFSVEVCEMLKKA